MFVNDHSIYMPAHVIYLTVHYNIIISIKRGISMILAQFNSLNITQLLDLHLIVS